MQNLNALTFNHSDEVRALRDSLQDFVSKEITPRERTRLKLTLRGKRLGLTLSEIRDLVDMYEPGRDERPQLERFLAVLETHKAALERQREDIAAQLAEIAAFEKRVRKQLGGGRKRG